MRWFYTANPEGDAIVILRMEGDRCVGHLAGIPQRYHRTGESLRMVFPLNIAVSETARGRGLMSEMSQACFDEAARRHGDAMLIGMPNAASTPGYTGRLGFRLVRPLPVRACSAIAPGLRAVDSHAVDASFLGSAAFATLLDDLDLAPAEGWGQEWTPELLRWRLSAPGARYSLHVSDRIVAVTSGARGGPVPVTAVLKLLRRRGARRASRASRAAAASAVIAAACWFSRTPLAVYAGFSDVADVVGVPVPRRLLPAPLNLILRSLRPGAFDAHAFDVTTMELLDFDAF